MCRGQILQTDGATLGCVLTETSPERFTNSRLLTLNP